MKTLLFLGLMLCALANPLYAQNDTIEFYITIPDKGIISNVQHIGDEIVPVFNNTTLNAIIANYEITEWKKEYPTSEYEDLRWVYRVRCNSMQLAEDLHNFSNTYFPYFSQLKTEYCYQPSDYGGWGSDQQMNFINAKTAWDYTKGDSNIVIGVSDTYFDLNHEDLVGKYAQVRTNSYTSTFALEHGTVVAGLIASRTDNGTTGMSSVGFNCKLDVSSIIGNGEVLAMSQQGRKVFNGSWLSGSIDSLYNKNHTYQPVYNEIYENGMIAIFAAGNARPLTERNNRTYVYPASLDHNISVTSIGWENGYNGTPGQFNAIDVHEENAGDSNKSYQHNDRVDICAPAIRLSTLYYHVNSTDHYGWRNAWGTSFASPLVAGTCGLMLSVNPWLTPYQMEVILKTKSRDVYNNPYNVKYYSGISRFQGSRIGSGALDAGAAVYEAVDYVVEHSGTQTFIIEGVDINTICSPGLASNGAYPILNVKLKNGMPPYTYKWDTIPGNTVTLSSMTSGSPNILASKGNGNDLAYFRLTVYDNSPIQKVANRVIKIKLIGDDTKYDLAMQDHYADMLDERNSMDSVNPRHWSIWESPDLINRYTGNTGNSSNGMAHQNPNFDSINYIHTRIKNVGCTNSPEARLHLYWTMPSTGEKWSQDWKGTSPPFNGNSATPVGGEITPPTGIVLNGLNPGQSQIISYEWQPPRPQDYDTSGTLPTLETCLLARIWEPNLTSGGMHATEVQDTKENVWENNNIVTRNLIVTNLNNSLRSAKKLILVSSASAGASVFTLQMLTEKDINPHYAGNLSRYLTAIVHLGDLYDVWSNGGKLGNVVAFDDDQKTVTYDFAKPLRLENIILQEHDRFPVYIEFNLKNNVSVPFPVTEQLIYFRQLTQYEEEVDLGDGTSFTRTRDKTYGDVTFSINIEQDKDAAKPLEVASLTQKDPAFKLYPNPASDHISIISLQAEQTASSLLLSDMTGRIILTFKNVQFEHHAYNLNTQSLQTGIYFINLTDAQGASHALKFIKAE